MSLNDVKLVLFNNITTKQTIVKNTFWMGLYHGVSRFLKLIFIIYVARTLGATEYGKFTFALAFVTLFQVLFGLGIDQIITRDFAKDKSREREISSLLSLKIVLGLGTLVVIWISSFFITSDPVIKQLILILGLFTFIENFCATIYAFFQARQKMEYHAWTKILESILITSVGLFVIFKFPLIENLAYTYLFSILVTFSIVLTILHLKIRPVSINWNTDTWKKFLKVSWPLALVAVCHHVYNHIDSVMMGYSGQITETGWYNAAYRVTGVALIPMSLIATNFYPVLSKASAESVKRLQKIWNYQMELMLIVAFPLVIGGNLLAAKIIDFIYGSEFTPSVLAFQILLFTTGIIVIYGGFHKPLIVVNQQKKVFLAIVAGAVLNIALNLILIPKYSLYGAAAATLVTHTLILFLEMFFITKFTDIKLFNLRIFESFIGAILCGVIMFFVISQPIIYSLNVVLTVTIGTLVYFACFVGYKKLIKFYGK